MKHETMMEEPNLFIRTEIASDHEEDAWDDSQLIKAYDKAVAKAKREIMKKIKSELMLSSTEVKEALSDTSGSKNKSKKKKKKKASSKNDLKWDVGSACRAIYSEDGEEYEAEIIAIFNKDWCRVKFIGYNNEEDTPVKSLKPSLGKDEIEAQMYYAAPVDNFTDSGETTGTQSYSEVPPQASLSWQTPFIPPQRERMFHHNSPPPPPPPPPPIHSAIFNRSTHPLGNTPFPSIPVDNDGLQSMLLSWFMCGYYTGCYQRDMENQQKPSAYH